MISSWETELKSQFESPYMLELQSFLKAERAQGKAIYPAEPEVFNAFTYTPLDKVKVVILGQDPYHGAGQAHGLAFSVKKGVAIPPSLRNIYKELQNDLSITPPQHGYLESWARQGVLLLNNVLTVEEGKAGSHHNYGWERFTDSVIEILNHKKENLVFILWGSPAQKKARQVDPNKHHLIISVHPSPLSAHRGFFGTRPFSKTNEYLISKSIEPIDWTLPV
jgi:uracil-DNA glycosylase